MWFFNAENYFLKKKEAKISGAVAWPARHDHKSSQLV